ncbi:LacI family DNA-binding transcriptional regulator [Silicimonas algicola]|uniref:DNA-binding LacI/PurR family transcriptional regulator n=1 Tax=Silicimonas algicola TaxID=1826607 RepID=A0A316FYM3_9RHOB|nr:LacI family DNA-binding transcriptional regulator [Silicimonas algicola]AZQ68421.1 LacI family DNA-binding transcriptional regulator [Silicimonas algicola]PWK53492.1 DNA-binding LacI/PurR family transcriptional regulator [Silicimonas algicola]
MGSAPKPLTSRQLASLLGVSQSAVSRAFTPGSSISADLRERILNGANEHDYRPNAIASMLTKRRTNIVGIVVSDMQNPFYPALIERLTQGLQRAGLQSLLFNITRGANIEDQMIAIRTYNVDAVVVIAATILNPRTLMWATEGRRSVLLNRLGQDDIDTVCCDNVDGARAIVDHLHSIGCRRVGYVAGLTKTAVGMTRHSAFTTRLAELGMRLTGTASGGVYSYDAGWRGALELLPERPDAIFFASDILALGGLDALKREGAAGDIATVGFDDIPMASWPGYALTTYRQPIDAIVSKTVDLIVAENPETPRQHLLVGDLVVRASTVPDVTPGLHPQP